MTATEVRTAAEAALAKIAQTPRGTVYASRKGIVAGVSVPGDQANLFRRKAGRVVFQTHTHQLDHPFTDYALPADLQSRAAAMLDAL